MISSISSFCTLLILLLATFTSRLKDYFYFDNFSILSTSFVFIGFILYNNILNRKYFNLLILFFIILVYYHFINNILQNSYLNNPSQYRDYSLFIFIGMPLLLICNANFRPTYSKYIVAYLFLTIAFIANSRSPIYFLASLYIIDITLSHQKFRELLCYFIAIFFSFLSFIGSINQDSYGDFINRLKFGFSSPTRINIDLPKNINNLGFNNLNIEVYNTHNIYFHIYIFVDKYLAIFSLIGVILLLSINFYTVYKYVLIKNSRVVSLSFSFAYFNCVYSNVESFNIWIYFLLLGLYLAFIYDLLNNKFIIKKS